MNELGATASPFPARPPLSYSLLPPRSSSPPLLCLIYRNRRKNVDEEKTVTSGLNQPGTGGDSAPDHLQIMNRIRETERHKSRYCWRFVKGLFSLETEAPRGWVLVKGAEISIK